GLALTLERPILARTNPWVDVAVGLEARVIRLMPEPQDLTADHRRFGFVVLIRIVDDDRIPAGAILDDPGHDGRGAGNRPRELAHGVIVRRVLPRKVVVYNVINHVRQGFRESRVAFLV